MRKSQKYSWKNLKKCSTERLLSWAEKLKNEDWKNNEKYLDRIYKLDEVRYILGRRPKFRA